MTLPKRLHAIAFSFVTAGLTSSALAATLIVTVDGAQSDKGQILVGLYNTASEYPAGKRIAEIPSPATTKTLKVVFTNLPKGEYALSSFHDANMNDRLDASMQGIPTESIGASRGAIGRMGPPKFKEAAFTIDNYEDTRTEAIHLKKAN